MYFDTVVEICERLPEYHRVDVEAWDNAPTFRVGKKNFLFASEDGSTLGMKLDKEEAAAVVASDPEVSPMGYGLGRHGWIDLSITKKPTPGRWREIEEWVRMSYTLVAPKKLARQVLEADGLGS